MTLNLDFVAIIAQLAINVALCLGVGTYLLSTYSWESNSKQEEEAET